MRFMRSCLIRSFLIVFLMGCAPVTITKNWKDSGSTFKMHSGDNLEIVLKANPTTGYGWEIASFDSTILKNTGTEYKADRVPSGIVGSGGKSIHRFKVRKTGKTFLKLIYRRPFEKNVPPIETFELTIVVKS